MLLLISDNHGILKFAYYLKSDSLKSNQPETLFFHQLTRMVASTQKVNRATERIFKESRDLAIAIGRLRMNITGSVAASSLKCLSLSSRKSLSLF